MDITPLIHFLAFDYKQSYVPFLRTDNGSLACGAPATELAGVSMVVLIVIVLMKRFCLRYVDQRSNGLV